MQRYLTFNLAKLLRGYGVSVTFSYTMGSPVISLSLARISKKSTFNLVKKAKEWRSSIKNLMGVLVWVF